MTTVLVVIGNGRFQYLKRAVESASKHLVVDAMVMVNDTGNPAYAPVLNETFPDFDIIVSHGSNKGMAMAVQSGWNAAIAMYDADYVFHLEEDFVLTEDLDLDAMRHVLATNEHLASLVLKRQAWAAEEVAAGGQIPLTEARGWPCIEHTQAVYEDGSDEFDKYRMVHWVEHESLFSLNPCLIPRRALDLGWPSGPLGTGNESGMTTRCLGAGMKFAYWGAKDDPPRAEHIGYMRGGEWQL